MARKFRKRPVVIEAARFLPAAIEAVRFFGPDPFTEIEVFVGGDAELRGGELIVATLAGPLRATFGDWIIKDIKGELYPCKPDIFEAAYEPTD